jgi:hypothetical protein
MINNNETKLLNEFFDISEDLKDLCRSYFEHDYLVYESNDLELNIYGQIRNNKTVFGITETTENKYYELNFGHEIESNDMSEIFSIILSNKKEVK